MGKQPESKLSRDIQKLIRSRGGYCFKVWGNPMMPAGIPDIICCYHGLFVGFETKMPLGGLQKIQAHTHRKILNADGFVFVPRSVQDASDALDEIEIYLSAWVNTEDESEAE